MKILLLGPNEPYQNELCDFLISDGNEVTFKSSKLMKDTQHLDNYDFLVSYGYRYIISKKVINQFKFMAINLHISYLPWNRGADPNLWSFIDDTPKGVTIHKIDEGIDTGDILVQKKVLFNENDTLETSYKKLQIEIIDLFKNNWHQIKKNECESFKQVDGGTFHKSLESESIMKSLPYGWKTSVKEIKGLI